MTTCSVNKTCFSWQYQMQYSTHFIHIYFIGLAQGAHGLLTGTLYTIKLLFYLHVCQTNKLNFR